MGQREKYWYADATEENELMSKNESVWFLESEYHWVGNTEKYSWNELYNFHQSEVFLHD